MALTVVQATHDLVTCMEMLVKGEGLSDLMVQEIHRQYRDDMSGMFYSIRLHEGSP